MVNAEIQVAVYFDVYFVDAESKEEAQDLHEKLYQIFKRWKISSTNVEQYS